MSKCTDCGSREAHWADHYGYCRPCAEKGGHKYLFYKCIDIDLLRNKVGPKLADEIIKECEDRFGCGC